MSSTLFNQRTNSYGLCFVALRPRNSNPQQMTPVVYMYRCKSENGVYTPCMDTNGNLIEDWDNPIAKCNWKKNGEVKVLDRDSWFTVLSREVRTMIADDIQSFYRVSQAEKT